MRIAQRGMERSVIKISTKDRKTNELGRGQEWKVWID